MKPGGGGPKGNAFENLVAKKLSRWFTEGDSKTELLPSRLSGGWKDGANRHAGDLAANGVFGEVFRNRFVVECKHHNRDLLWGLFLPLRNNNIPGWWHKLCNEAEQWTLCPMLVIRQNSRPILVGLPADLVLSLYGAEGPIVQYNPTHRSHPVCSLILWDVLVDRTALDVYTYIEGEYL